MCHNVLEYFTVHLVLCTLWIGVPCFHHLHLAAGYRRYGHCWVCHTRHHQHSSIEFDWYLWSGFHHLHLLNTVAYGGPWFFIIIRNTIAKMGCDSSPSSLEKGCLWRAVILHHHNYSRPTRMYLCGLSLSSSLRLIVWTSDYPATVGHVLTSSNHPEWPYDT